MSEPVRWLDDPSSTPALRDAIRALPARAPDLRTEVLDAVATNLRRAPASGSGVAIAGVVTGIVALGLVLTAVLPPSVAPSRDKTVLERAALGVEDRPAEIAVPVAPTPPTLEPEVRIEVPRERTRARTRAVAQHATPDPHEVPAAAESEAELLRRARRALGSDPAEALALAAEHQATHPRGMLVLEREVVAIDALLRLGRIADAAARRAEIEASYPNTLYRERIDRLFRARE